MNEKILIKSERYNLKKLFLTFLIVAVVASGIFLAYSYSDRGTIYKGYWIVAFCIFAGITLIGAAIFAIFKNSELTVTDKRVYGVSAFGKRVDLPVDSISATAKLKWGVSVATSSGNVRFRFLKNAQDIYDILNNLVIERQKKENKATAPVNSTTIIQSSDNADQLKKFKDLLDSGIISQEEFDAQKKQLLGL